MKRAAMPLLLFAISMLAPSAGAQSVTDVYDFASGGGTHPRQGLTLGGDGLLYGGTQTGGPTNDGTLFSFEPGGSLSTVYAFSGPDGAQPYGPLVLGPGGNLYGTTSDGGVSGLGTVFELTGSGLSTVHSFSGSDGSNPLVGLTADGEGDLFGATNGGGSGKDGTVFEIAANGTFQTLCDFSGANGETPASNVAIGPDGTLYGTTKFGGANDRGIVYEISPSGALSTLHSFDTSDGSEPMGAVIYGPDGNLYGTTAEGGTYGTGTVFQLTSSGTLNTLHSFHGTVDGQEPSALLLGNDGNFYGTAEIGGASSEGAVFALSPTGNFTLLHAFAGTPDGSTPTGTLALTPGGRIYGTTANGGANALGCIFSFTEMGTPDTTAPITTASIAGPGTGDGYYTGSVTVTLTATDAGAGVASTYFTVDGGPVTTYTGPFGVSGETTHTVSYWSVDWANNVEAAQSTSFTINSQAPVTTASLSGTAGANGWYAGPVTVTLTATSPIPVTTFYTVDAGSAQAYSRPFTISAQGVHTVTFSSTDAAGNSNAAQSITIEIDSIPPSITFEAATPPANAADWNNSPVSLPFTVGDSGSGVASTSLGSPLQFSSEGEGQTLTITASDVAGNTSTATSPDVNIDLTPPSTTASVTGSTVTLSATDNLSGVASTNYTVDGGSTQTYSAPFTVSGAGSHVVSYWSTDVAGNVEASQSIPVTVASPALGLTLTSMTPDSASAFGWETYVTLTGTGFRQGDIVSFGCMANETAVDSSTQLQIYLWPIELLLSNRSMPVQVVDPNGTRSNALTFTVTDPCWWW